MLIDNAEVEKRLNNPLNLINKMRNGLRPADKVRSKAMSLFIRPESSVPDFAKVFPQENPAKEAVESIDISMSRKDNTSISTSTPTSNELVEDLDTKVKLALAHDNALDALTSAIATAKLKMDDIKPEKLPSVITAMSKVVTDIRKERLERDKVNRGTEVHHHFYMPQQKTIDAYEVIEVNG